MDNKNQYKELLANLELGKKSKYETKYNPNLLQIVPRSLNRDTLEIETQFYGFDVWHMYELSCLNPKGKPLVFMGITYIPSTSKFIVESKSFKLYLNSFNQTKISSKEEFEETIQKDISKAISDNAKVILYPLNEANKVISCHELEGKCIDDLDIEVNDYEVNPKLLKQDDGDEVTETISSNLLKSNCLITSQPDWGSIVIKYSGKPINHESLLKYIISFRNHNEFHEHCVERIFTDIVNNLEISNLEVRAYYTRRGGLDINPVRTMKPIEFENLRLIRQ